MLLAGREASEAVQPDVAATQQAPVSQCHLLGPRRSELHAQSPVSHQVPLAALLIHFNGRSAAACLQCFDAVGCVAGRASGL